MSFKRNVQRNHKSEITHQQVQQKSEFKSNFNFTWIPFNYKSLIILAVIFAFTQFLCVPFIAQFYGYTSSLILTHGILTSLLIVMSFQLNAKAPASALFIRYCFCALILGGFMLALVMLIKL